MNIIDEILIEFYTFCKAGIVRRHSLEFRDFGHGRLVFLVEFPKQRLMRCCL